LAEISRIFFQASLSRTLFGTKFGFSRIFDLKGVLIDWKKSNLNGTNAVHVLVNPMQ
jgi:hypothetical protein